MALSFKAVEKAYKVFHELKSTVVPQLNIPSFPKDMSEWPEYKRANPKSKEVYGFGKKQDDGWEELVFFINNPSDELIEKFQELKFRVPNSSICRKFQEKGDLWIFGWF